MYLIIVEVMFELRITSLEVKFCLKKAGRETHSLVTNVQRKTGLGKQDFRFAGTKDKNGITYQWVTF